MLAVAAAVRWGRRVSRRAGVVVAVLDAGALVSAAMAGWEVTAFAGLRVAVTLDWAVVTLFMPEAGR